MDKPGPDLSILKSFAHAATVESYVGAGFGTAHDSRGVHISPRCFAKSRKDLKCKASFSVCQP